MNALLRRTARGATVDNGKGDKSGISIFPAELGNGFEAIFAVCVLLGALWLLVSGYA